MVGVFLNISSDVFKIFLLSEYFCPKIRNLAEIFLRSVKNVGQHFIVE